MKTYFLNHLNLSMLNCLVLLLLSWCAKVLTILEVKTWLSPLAKRKSLVLDTKLDKWNLPGIANLLQSSPYLEKLVINLVPFYNSEVRFYFIVRTTATLFFFHCCILQYKVRINLIVSYHFYLIYLTFKISNF